MLNLVICGAPGSGKGTQSELLVKKYNLKHLSTGDILRNEIAADTPHGQLADTYMSKGHLVPDELIIGLISDEFDRLSGYNGVILDGFPRTIEQAVALDRMLDERGKSISAMIDLQVEEEELIFRLLNRGRTSGRNDDTLEVIRRRLEVYHEKTAPISNYYKEQRKYNVIKGIGTIEEIFEVITGIIDGLNR